MDIVRSDVDMTQPVYVVVLMSELDRLKRIEIAAQELDQHAEEGYASLVSYLIRLHEALSESDKL